MLLIYFDIYTRRMVSLPILWPSRFTQTWSSRRPRPSPFRWGILQLPSQVLPLWISQGTGLAPNKVTNHCPDWCQRHNIMMDNDLKWNHMTQTYRLKMIIECYPLVSASASQLPQSGYTGPALEGLWVQTAEYDRHIGMRYHYGKMSNLLEIWYLVWQISASKADRFSSPCSLFCVVLMCIKSPHT